MYLKEYSYFELLQILPNLIILNSEDSVHSDWVEFLDEDSASYFDSALFSHDDDLFTDLSLLEISFIFHKHKIFKLLRKFGFRNFYWHRIYINSVLYKKEL